MNELALSEGQGLRELALFAGAGGGILGGHLLGWRTVAAVEIEDYPRRVLLQRQADGFLPRFPIWDDVTTFDGKPWQGKVDVVSGGFPCQDISAAGRGAGIEGERSGLWSEMARIISEVRPQYAWVENSPLLISRGLSTVLGDLAEMGYDARWGIVSAANAGAPHKRERCWIVAYANEERLQGCVNRLENVGRDRTQMQAPGISGSGRGEEWKAEPSVGRLVDGVAHRMDRLKALGNGQVPQAMALAWRILTGEEKI